MYFTYLNTPVDKLLIAGDEEGLKFISFCNGKKIIHPNDDWIQDCNYFKDQIKQMEEYFTGKRFTFDFKLAPFGTPFQMKVLCALQKIPYGKTVSYGFIAKSIGHPKASRAVGAANGRNPLSIVIPCHRVIGGNGDLVGFGGGLSTKEKLLALEKNNNTNSTN